jgi:hypothetical protein
MTPTQGDITNSKNKRRVGSAKAGLFIASIAIAVLVLRPDAADSARITELSRVATELDAAAASAESFRVEDIEEMAEVRELPLVIAEHAMRLESATVGLEERIETLWADSYAGMWLSTGSIPGLTIAFTDLDLARNATVANWFGYPAEINYVSVPNSMVELVALQRALRNDRLLLQAGGRIGVPDIDDTEGKFDLDIDVRLNRVVIVVGTVTNDVRKAFTNRWGDAWVVVKEGPVHPECAQTDCYDNMMGGLQLQTYQLIAICTSAFSALDGPDEYVLSAAHCHESSASRYHAGHWFGEVWTQQRSGRVDAEAILTGGSAWEMKGKVWLAADDRRSIYYYITWASITVGTRVTKSGYVGGTQQGDITSKNYAPSGVPLSERFVLADYCGSDGDSGGGVLRNNTAYGIHHGGDDNGPNTNCPTPEESVFGAINYAMNALDVALQAGP